MSGKQTRSDAATKSSSVLRDENASSKEKSAAASALSQKDTSGHKQTGHEAASKASSVLKSDNATSHEKSAAGSALSQKENKHNR